MPRVSIIISCYKTDRFIETFLGSIKSQTYNDFELVIHTNETSEIEQKCIDDAKNYIDIIHIEDETVIPLYAAWNKCINKSTGDLICINNTDDLRFPDSLENMVDSFTDDVEFCYGNFIISSTFNSSKGYLIDETGRENELTTGMILGPFFMFRRSVLDKCGMFDEQFKTGGDFDFAMRLGRTCKGVHTEKLLGVYLDEGKGLSTGSELQPIERTVIERRYNLKITEPQYIEKTNDYDLENIIIDGIMTPVKEFI